MAFWSGEKLIEVGDSLIAGFDKDRLDCNAYTLRIGGEFYCTADKRRKLGQHPRKMKLSDGEPFVIPAGQFAYLITKERIKVPPEAMAFISIKATVKWQGLMNVSGFHVDPGYEGALVFSVYNAGPSPIHLEEGLPLFLIWFASLDRPSAEIYRKAGGKSITNDLMKGMNREVLSLQSLSKEISELRSSMRVQTAIVGYAVVLITALFVAIMGPKLREWADELWHPVKAPSAISGSTTTGQAASPNAQTPTTSSVTQPPP